MMLRSSRLLTLVSGALLAAVASVLAAYLATGPVQAITCLGSDKQWAGASTGDWSVAGNWSPSGAPTTTDNVCINSSATVTLASGSSSINSLKVGSGSTLTISGGTLTIASASTID